MDNLDGPDYISWKDLKSGLRFPFQREEIGNQDDSTGLCPWRFIPFRTLPFRTLPDGLAFEFLTDLALTNVNQFSVINYQPICHLSLTCLFSYHLSLTSSSLIKHWLKQILVLEVIPEELELKDEFSELAQGSSWSDTAKELLRLSPLYAPGEGNGNPLQCSCLENPRDGGAWWAAVYGVAQSRTRLKQLTSIKYHGLRKIKM